MSFVNLSPRLPFRPYGTPHAVHMVSTWFPRRTLPIDLRFWNQEWIHISCPWTTLELFNSSYNCEIMSSTTMDLKAQATAVYTPKYRASILEPPPPPAGLKANYDGPNSAGMFYIAFTVFFYFFTFSFTAMRVYTKAFLTRSLGWDDCTSMLTPMSTKTNPGSDTCVIAAVRRKINWAWTQTNWGSAFYLSGLLHPSEVGGSRFFTFYNFANGINSGHSRYGAIRLEYSMDCCTKWGLWEGKTLIGLWL